MSVVSSLLRALFNIPSYMLMVYSKEGVSFILTYSHAGAAEDPILVEVLVSWFIAGVCSPFKVLATPLQLNWREIRIWRYG